MQLVTNSMSIILLGDWNQLYMQPDWIAQNIFEAAEIEVGIEPQGASFRISYRKDGVEIKPTQMRVEFSSQDTQEGTLEMLAKCIKNYFDKAVTPQVRAYGFNLDYVDEEDTRLSKVFDSLSDAESIFKLGYTIGTSRLNRELLKDDKIINIGSSIDHAKTKIHFNEHHNISCKEDVSINKDILLGFIEETRKIVEGFGYEVEDEKHE